MLIATFRPLHEWPRTPTRPQDRTHSPFRSKYLDTLDLLERELNMIGAGEITIYADVSASNVRNDGWLKANINPTSPGIVIEFRVSDAGKVTMPCDRFHDWRDNLRAIALSLEALRKVDRYGVTQAHEQYKGFKSLPAPGGSPGAEFTRTDAAMLLEAVTNKAYSRHELVSSSEAVKNAFRIAVATYHPDKGGDRHQYEMILKAREVLNNV